MPSTTNCLPVIPKCLVNSDCFRQRLIRIKLFMKIMIDKCCWAFIPIGTYYDLASDVLFRS